MLTLSKPRAFFLTVAAVCALLLSSVTTAPTNSAQAANGADFNPGQIISDSVFYSGQAMSAQEIQAFLNVKVPRCTLGDAGRPAGGVYTFPNGSQTLLATTCLKDYSASISSLAGDSYCAALTGGTMSAAEMIYRVGVACNVSQKALLVLLEKEQSLISDSFPAQTQMDRATGFNCPDTAPCSSVSAGFFKQVYSAARQFQVYGTGSYNWYPVGQVSNVRYHPNADCGASPVLIQNRATAALYYYTPYQPNSAALGNLYGAGDGCSAYGNRNFWRLYTDWFGSTTEPPGVRQFVKAAYNDVLGRAPESEAVIQFWVGKILAGMSRADMANAFNSSEEYRYNKVVQAYNNALKRAPEQAGADFWMNRMRNGLISPEDLYSTFLYSDEMFNVQGGGTNAGYVTSMYRELLLRDPEPAGLEHWTTRLNRGEPRDSISSAIWNSPEKNNVRVNQTYQALLGRVATQAEQESWSAYARAYGATAMRSAIMSSDEYWKRAKARF